MCESDLFKLVSYALLGCFVDFFFACLFSVYGVFLLSLLFVVVDRLLLTY